MLGREYLSDPDISVVYSMCWEWHLHCDNSLFYSFLEKNDLTQPAYVLYVRYGTHLIYISFNGPPVAQFAEFSKVPKGFSKLCNSMENTYQKLIISSDASRQDTSNGVRVAYVNFYHMWVLRQG
jgi:hypothetical protein